MQPKEEFLFQIGALDVNLRNELCTAIGHFAIPIILDWTFCGSGTLVKIGGHCGILTAGHVLFNPHDRTRHIDTSAGSRQILRTSVADFPHDLCIDSQFLRVWALPWKCEEYGPDLAFVLIPDGPFLREIRAKKSFAELANPDELYNAAVAIEENGISIVAGFADVDRIEGKPELGFDEVQGLIGHGFVTGQDFSEIRNGYDYVEVGACYKTGDRVPESFGGVSGGGLWRAPVLRKKNDPLGKEYFGRYQLAGVVFYQTAVEADYRRLRAHGPASLFKNFLPFLSKELGC